jgi:hypothetical protein
MQQVLSWGNRHFGVSFVFFSLIIGFVTIGILLASRADASTSYPFLIRGHVQAVNVSGKSLELKFEHGSVKAINEHRLQTHAVIGKSATVYKWVNDVKKIKTFSDIAVGNEVVVHGNKSSSGIFTADWITVNDNTFTVIGKIKENNEANRQLKVLVYSSTYQPSTWKNKTITLNYNTSARCMRLGNDLNCVAIPSNLQWAKIKGTGATAGNPWEITHYWDSYPAPK